MVYEHSFIYIVNILYMQFINQGWAKQNRESTKRGVFKVKSR